MQGGCKTIKKIALCDLYTPKNKSEKLSYEWFFKINFLTPAYNVEKGDVKLGQMVIHFVQKIVHIHQKKYHFCAMRICLLLKVYGAICSMHV